MLRLLIAAVVMLDAIMDSHQGFSREYVFALMENRNNADRFSSQSAIIVLNPHEYAVNISATVPLNLHLLNTGHTVQPFEFISIPLKRIDFYLLDSGVSSKGISVIADADVLVFVRNKIASSDDIYYVYSTSHLSDNYVAITNCENPGSCEIAVVGVRENTRIDFTFPTSMNGPVTYNGTLFSPGDKLIMTLDTYETFQLQSQNDLSGVRIEASFPILSLAGSTLTKFSYGGKDHIGDTLPPTCYLGTHYVIASPAFAVTPEHLKIVTLYNDTQVRVTGIDTSGTSVTLCSEIIEEKYHVLSLQLTCTLCRIDADHPVIASHFPVNQNTGDPGMYIAVPVEHFRSRYFLPVPYNDRSFCKLSVTLSTKWDSTGDILLNNDSVSDTLIWEIDRKGGYKVAWINITGNYMIEISHSSGKPFGGHIVCENSYLVTTLPFVSIPQGSCNSTHYVTSTSKSTTEEQSTTKPAPTTGSEYMNASTTQGATDNVNLLHHTPVVTVSTDTSSFIQNGLTTGQLPQTTNKDCTYQANSVDFATTSNSLYNASNLRCYLICDSKSMTIEELQNNIKELKKQLTVDKKKTTVAIYKKISAGDDRMSSKFIGTVAIIILILVFGSIVLMDIGRFINFIKYCNQTKKCFCKA